MRSLRGPDLGLRGLGGCETSKQRAHMRRGPRRSGVRSMNGSDDPNGDANRGGGSKANHAELLESKAPTR